MRLDLRRMSWPELANLLKDVAREIEQRGVRSANPQYRASGGHGGGFPNTGGSCGSNYGGPSAFRPSGPRKKRFGRPRGPGGPAQEQPPRDGDFNR